MYYVSYYYEVGCLSIMYLTTILLGGCLSIMYLTTIRWGVCLLCILLL